MNKAIIKTIKKLLPLLILVSLSINAQVTVGWDASCDYDESQSPGQIQQAIDDANTEIRVTNQQEFAVPVLINDTVVLKGGYNTCADAVNDVQSQVTTVINGVTFTQEIIKIDTNSSVRDILIDNFEIKGNQSSQNYSGGITVLNSSGIVTLSNLYIHNVDSSGGLEFNNAAIPSGSALNINMNNVISINNSSTSGGAGMRCDSNGTIELSISGESGFSYNHSEGNGGGIYLRQCNLMFSSGTDSPSMQNPLGIHANTADKSSGGLFIGGGSHVTLTGNQMNPVNITENTSNLDEISSGDGGAIKVSGISPADPSTLIASNVWIASNRSINQSGGAVYVDFHAEVNIFSDQKGCNWNDFCSLIENNIAKDGGAVSVEDSGHLMIAGTEMRGNRAESAGSLAHIRGDDSSIVIENSLIHHNGGVDHTEFSDFYLIRNTFGNNSITIAYSSIVDNSAQFASINAYNGSDGEMNLYGSIIDDPGIAAATVPGTVLLGEVICNILGNDNSINNVPINTQIFETTPAFVNRANQDYHLDPLLTLGIDQCESIIYQTTTVDMDGDIRGIDHEDFINNPGLYDIGVDEVNKDLIYKNGFE